MKNLKKLMNPKSVAIIGASEKAGTVGNELVLRAIEANFNGKLVAVNPNYKTVCGLECFGNVSNISFQIDLAVIAVPAKAVLGILKDAKEARIDCAVIVSSGFKEIGGEGVILEKEIADFANENNMTILGPNCLGLINTFIGLNVCFAPTQPQKGFVGLATQSGALASGIINYLPKLNMGVGQIASLGNQCQVNCLDLLNLWETDKNIKVIMLYLESIPNEREFREIATRVSMQKPILVIKAGRSELGAKATASHTGSLAGNDLTTTGLLASCGVIREISLKDWFNSAKVLLNCPIPRGSNLAILTNAGGPGVMAADVASELGFNFAVLSDATKKKLAVNLPMQASLNNPVDIIASASAEQYYKSAEILLDANEVDMLLVIYLYISGKNDIQVMKDLEKLKQKYKNKPIVVSLMTTVDFNKELQAEFPTSSIPTFEYVDDALHSLKRLLDRKEFLENFKGFAEPKYRVDRKNVDKILNFAKQNGVKNLSTLQSMDVFSAYGLPVPQYRNVSSLSEAKEIAKVIGYPVVLKISSSTITHKSDIGGVVVNIESEAQLEFEWNSLIERLKKLGALDSLDGIVVMKQVKGSGRELVAGVVLQNGIHQMMFGMGGIFVEALKEVTFRPCPITEFDAKKLITETKANNLLGNLRGKACVDKKILEEILVKISMLVTDFPEIIELDANPIMVDEQGNLVIVDARVIL